MILVLFLRYKPIKLSSVLWPLPKCDLKVLGLHPVQRPNWRTKGTIPVWREAAMGKRKRKRLLEDNKMERATRRVVLGAQPLGVFQVRNGTCRESVAGHHQVMGETSCWDHECASESTAWDQADRCSPDPNHLQIPNYVTFLGSDPYLLWVCED